MKKWICVSCGQEVYSKEEKPTPLKWNDGHICDYAEVE